MCVAIQVVHYNTVTKHMCVCVCVGGRGYVSVCVRVSVCVVPMVCVVCVCVSICAVKLPKHMQHMFMQIAKCGQNIEQLSLYLNERSL